jgi:Tfp pilus assembly PilM family ATPase
MSTRQSMFSRLFASPPPSAAIEITSRRVNGAVIAEHGGARVVASFASEALPAGAVVPALNVPNVHDAAALSRTIKSVVEKLSPRPRRVALVVPDPVAKLSLLHFEKIPPKAQDLDQLIRWQIRKAAPFKIEDAQLAWVPGRTEGSGGEFVVTVARRDIIDSYERACETAGVHAGIIDLASVNLVNAVLATGGAPSGDWLLVHVAPDYGTLAVVRAGQLIFFRNRATEGEDDLTELVHQTAMYHEDRLGGGGFGRVVLAGASSRGADQAERLRRHVEERVGSAVEAMDFRGAVSMRDRIAAAPDLLDALAPAIGVILRERVA